MKNAITRCVACWVKKTNRSVNEFLLAQRIVISFRTPRAAWKCREQPPAEKDVAREAFVYQPCESKSESGRENKIVSHTFSAAENISAWPSRCDEICGALYDLFHTPQASETFVTAREQTLFGSDEFNAARF